MQTTQAQPAFLLFEMPLNSPLVFGTGFAWETLCLYCGEGLQSTLLSHLIYIRILEEICVNMISYHYSLALP